MLTQLADRMDKVLSLKQIMQQMTVNKMLHDGVVRDTQLASAPSKRCVGRSVDLVSAAASDCTPLLTPVRLRSSLKRIHAWGADQGSHIYD